MPNNLTFDPIPAAPTSGMPDELSRPDIAPPALTWIPIRSLAPRHRPRILEHLRLLSEADRYLRFGYQISDSNLDRYVQGLNFERDEIFGVFNRHLRITALAHLAYPAPMLDAATAAVAPESPASAAEFGGSVLAHLRGRGYGARLFEHAILHARNRGLSTIYIHALSENAGMLRIARNAGATVHRDGSETEAYVKLPPETLASHAQQVVSGGAAALDYRIKRNAHLVGAWWGGLAEMRDDTRNAGPDESS